jgi:hypothetical protein
MQENPEQVRLVNPIDEVLTEKEGKERGYLEFTFINNYLEDENETIKLFIVNGKRIVVQSLRPKYGRPPQINYERVHAEPAVCTIDDPECTSCGS